MSYREALEWLYGLQVYGIKLGLENIRRLCEALEVELETSERRKFVHVAGTNGKGSVCAMMAAICSAAGERTGLYTSPHLVSFRERIRLGEQWIPEAHVAELLSTIRKRTEAWENVPTFFEVVTAVALRWFQQQRAEWVILETGLGGRLDATNVVTPAVSVITPIGLDHTKHLGTTLAEIAREKAGIIKPGVPVISAPQAPKVLKVLKEIAAERGCRLTVIEKPVGANWDMALAGSHQRSNAAVAFAALTTAGLRPEPRQVGQALARVVWPGRFQRVEDGRIILDGAHNPEAAARLVETWREEFGEERATLVLGVLADKDVPGVCKALAPIAARVICVRVRSPRSMEAEALCKIMRRRRKIPCSSARGLAEALEEARRGPERVLVAGSLFLVGDALVQLGLAQGEQEVSAQ